MGAGAAAEGVEGAGAECTEADGAGDEGPGPGGWIGAEG
ncbi:hypothetical protein YWIDRAFT_05030 [Streptomyces sp. SceaMP-e96]|nr:hypothetical protein YWIDRAFT_05030 [Streptomyces sp. SceaMP-e96]